MRTILNWVIQGAEYTLAGLFIWGAVSVFTRVEPVTTDIEYIQPLIGEAAVFIYGVLFGLMGLALLSGKTFKLRRTHGYSLMGMYLIGIYIIILKVLLEGLSTDITLSVVATVAAALLYLRWKYNILQFHRPTRKQVIRDLFNE